MKPERPWRGGRRTAPGSPQAPTPGTPAELQRVPVDVPSAPAARGVRRHRGGPPADLTSAADGQLSGNAGDNVPVPPGAHPEPGEVDLALAAGVTCCPLPVAGRIFERLANGESLLAICRDPAMPGRTTVLGWIERDPAFAAAYARARDHQADALDDEMAEVMSDVKAGRMDPAAARVWLSGAQWRAAKLAPRRYGDSLNLKHSGGIAAMPIEVSFEQAARTAQAILDGINESAG
jgi:hypothetical protein